MGFILDNNVKAVVILPKVDKENDSDVDEGWDRIS